MVTSNQVPIHRVCTSAIYAKPPPYTKLCIILSCDKNYTNMQELQHISVQYIFFKYIFLVCFISVCIFCQFGQDYPTQIHQSHVYNRPSTFTWFTATMQLHVQAPITRLQNISTQYKIVPGLKWNRDTCKSIINKLGVSGVNTQVSIINSLLSMTGIFLLTFYYLNAHIYLTGTKMKNICKFQPSCLSLTCTH